MIRRGLPAWRPGPTTSNPTTSSARARRFRTAAALAALALAAVALAQLPPFLAVGSRLSWHAGGSSLAGARMVPDPEGPLIRNGQRYRLVPTRGGGGIGVQQLDVVVSSEGLLVADARSFLDTAAGGGVFVASGIDAIVGNAQGLGEYWTPPAQLAALRPGRDGQTEVSRGVRSFGGADREVVTIAVSRPDTYASHTYDLATGLLLFGGTVYRQDGARILDDNGQLLEDLRGSSGYTHLAFLGLRQLEVPWSRASAPAWAAPGATIVYEGTRRAEFAQAGGLPPLPGDGVRVVYTLQQRLGDALLVGSLVEDTNPASIPMPGTTSQRVFAWSGFDCLWIPPDALARLAPGALLDRDPYTRQDVVYAGLSGELHVLVAQGAGEVAEFYYDRGSGFLAFTRHRRQADQVGVMVTELAYVGMR